MRSDFLSQLGELRFRLQLFGIAQNRPVRMFDLVKEMQHMPACFGDNRLIFSDDRVGVETHRVGLLGRGRHIHTEICHIFNRYRG